MPLPLVAVGAAKFVGGQIVKHVTKEAVKTLAKDTIKDAAKDAVTDIAMDAGGKMLMKAFDMFGSLGEKGKESTLNLLNSLSEKEDTFNDFKTAFEFVNDDDKNKVIDFMGDILKGSFKF